MTVFNIIVPEEWEDKKTGELKTQYHRVGVAFQNKAGGFNCKVPNGLALTGEFIILPRKDRAEDDGTQGLDDDIPL
jgi:hypothetical protein